MVKNATSCIRISDTGICPHCNTKNLVKNGFTKNKKQQFYCKNCYKRCIDFYCYKAYKLNTNIKIIQFIKEGLGIRSTARILQISTTTVLKRIIAIAKKIPNPIFFKNKSYEVDEMRCYLKRVVSFLFDSQLVFCFVRVLFGVVVPNFVPFCYLYIRKLVLKWFVGANTKTNIK